MAGWVGVQWFSSEFSGRSWSCPRGYWEREGGHQGSPGAAAVRQGGRWTNPSFSFFGCLSKAWCGCSWVWVWSELVLAACSCAGEGSPERHGHVRGVRQVQRLQAFCCQAWWQPGPLIINKWGERVFFAPGAVLLDPAGQIFCENV